MRGPSPSPVLGGRRALALIAAIIGMLCLVPTRVASAPSTPTFGPVIDEYAEYVGQTRCRPKAKPGVVAFQQLLQTAYPESTWFAIGRPCKVGGQSEHKEGRALDWARNAAVPAERAQVRELLGWLLAPDSYGNPHAMARRLGVMYIIWNRRMWSSWDAGWEVICVQKGKRCRDPETGAVVHAHRDHVHFSFGWPGARMLTTFWHPELSQPSPSPTPSPSTSP